MRELHDQDVLDTALKRSEEVTEAFGVTTIDAALRWAYYHSALAENDGIILGASSIAQIESKVESIGRGPLPEELLRISNGIWKGLEPSRGDVIRHILIYNWNRPTGLVSVLWGQAVNMVNKNREEEPLVSCNIHSRQVCAVF